MVISEKCTKKVYSYKPVSAILYLEIEIILTKPDKTKVIINCLPTYEIFQKTITFIPY